MTDIFVKTRLRGSIEAFVTSLEETIGLGPWEERFSSNVADGRYFRARALGVEIKVGVADLKQFSEYDFMLWFAPELLARPPQELDGLRDCTARKLALFQQKVARPLDPRGDAGSIVYRRNPDPSANAGDRVVTEHKM